MLLLPCFVFWELFLLLICSLFLPKTKVLCFTCWPTQVGKKFNWFALGWRNHIWQTGINSIPHIKRCWKFVVVCVYFINLKQSNIYYCTRVCAKCLFVFAENVKEAQNQLIITNGKILNSLLYSVITSTFSFFPSANYLILRMWFIGMLF